MKDGWHTIKDNDVYIEDGLIVRGTSKDGQHTTYPYRWDKDLNCFVKKSVKPETFRKSNLYEMK